MQQVLDVHQDEIPAAVRRELRDQLGEVIATSRTQAEQVAAQVGLLGALATAGVTTLAYEHEISKQLSLLDDLRKSLATGNTRREKNAAAQLDQWLTRARGTRQLFGHLLDEPAREETKAFRALPVVRSVLEQTAPFLRGVDVAKPTVDRDIVLPAGRFSEWVAIFQNVIINASNAMIDSDMPRLFVRSIGAPTEPALQFLDSGVGVDVANSNRLFEPFVRELDLSPERRAMRLGGSGLGLTIVRMLSDNLGCTARFVEPDPPWATCFEIAWQRA